MSPMIKFNSVIKITSIGIAGGWPQQRNHNTKVHYWLCPSVSAGRYYTLLYCAELYLTLRHATAAYCTVLFSTLVYSQSTFQSIISVILCILQVSKTFFQTQYFCNFLLCLSGSGYPPLDLDLFHFERCTRKVNSKCNNLY